MRFPRRQFLQLATSAGALPWLSRFVSAQDVFPARTVTIVVPAPPGGVLDLLARTIGERLAQKWGHSVIVENKPGANFQIGAAFVAKAPADGYTLLVCPEVVFTVNPFLYKTVQYDPVNGFAPISGLAIVNEALIARPTFPATDTKDLIALARSKPGGIYYGTFGVGSTAHLQMALFETMAGVKLSAIHYNGAQPALLDLLGGHIDVLFIDTRSALANQVKVLALGSAARLPEFPGTSTIGEDLPGFQARTWFGLFAPGGMPADIVTKISADIRTILMDSSFRDQILSPNMFEPMLTDPARFSAFIKSEAEKWSKVMHDLDLKVD